MKPVFQYFILIENNVYGHLPTGKISFHYIQIVWILKGKNKVRHQAIYNWNLCINTFLLIEVCQYTYSTKLKLYIRLIRFVKKKNWIFLIFSSFITITFFLRWWTRNTYHHGYHHKRGFTTWNYYISLDFCIQENWKVMLNIHPFLKEGYKQHQWIYLMNIWWTNLNCICHCDRV